ncbi:winged helix-turn-helix domain-containing protein [Rhizocola hellebori]|uniref:winged helix-turn-helix domain-containing protein n=1 Tax=Rhizocola hellebori TaxID=1392758 RepID=UPI001EF34163|nr:helix-turn-helix domain-containing protein [Rhizocola hellebori]
MKLTPVSLRGLAHPLRVRMLGMLREQGPATATLLAQRLDQSSGATSYHLRQLAAHGFVEELAGKGVRRERWWRAASDTTIFGGPFEGFDPADAEAYLRAVAAQYSDRVDSWISEAAAMPKEWAHAATNSDWRLRLTPQECRELHDEIFALAQRYRTDDAPGPSGAQRVFLQVQLLPFVREQA